MFLSDLVSLSSFVFSVVSILFLLKFFGKAGLFVFSMIAVIATNIQVLKVVQYSFWDTPIPLGTVLFSCMFAVDNILNEYYGPNVAKMCVYLSFIGYLIFSVLMILSDAHPIVTNTNCANFAQDIHNLFSPSFVFFTASIAAYLAGQFCDITIYSLLKTNIFVKSAIAMIASTFVDNLVFSILAWKIFAVIPIPWKEILHTYILNTSIFRIVIVTFCIPVVYLAKYFLPKNAAKYK